MMHIGDLLLVTPLLRTLRTNYKNAHIALLADAKLSDLVKNNPNINELIAIDKKGYHNRLKNYLAFVREIRQKNFDLVINLHANERASFCAAFSGAKKLIGYSSLGLGIMFHKLMKNRKELKHQVEAHLDVLREFLGVTEIDNRGLEMYLDADTEKRMDDFWQKNFGQASGYTTKETSFPVVALNTGASWLTKRWCKESYAQLADKLLQLNYGVVFLGGMMDKELVSEITALMRQKNQPLLKIFTGELKLMELAAILKKCAVLVTNDSGPMHIAVAMDTPLVAMFGPSPVLGFAPYNDKSVSLKTPLSCHPCNKHFCDTLDCMKQIPVETVLEHTLELIKKYEHEPRPLRRNIGAYDCRVVEL
jgi:lipopolysaccharide heptosyltransferase II